MLIKIDKNSLKVTTTGEFQDGFTEYTNEEEVVFFFGKNHSESNLNPAKDFLNSYPQNPKRYVADFDGYFGVVLLNKQNKSLTLFRDPLGMQPLYYAQDEFHFYISNVMNSMVSVLKDLTFCEEFFLLFLEDGVPETYELTLYNEIKRAVPNQAMEFENFAELNRSELYAFGSEKELELPYSQVIDELRNRLEDAIQKSLIDNKGKIHAQYSGGFDSTGIVAVVKHLFGIQNLQTYTHNYAGDNPEIDELRDIKRLHNDEGMPLPLLIPELKEEYDELYGEDATRPINMKIINQVLGLIYDRIEKNEVLLSGFGGDECLSFNRIPTHLLNLVNPKDWPALFKEVRLYGIKQSLSVFLKRGILPSAGRLLKGAVYTNKFRYRKRDEVTQARRQQLKSTKAAIPYMLTLPHVSTRIEEEKELANLRQVKIEYPWLNFQLIRFILRLPAKYIIQNGKNRILYKDALRKYFKEDWYFKLTKSGTIFLQVSDDLYREDKSQRLAEALDGSPMFILKYAGKMMKARRSKGITEYLEKRLQLIKRIID
ncbi:asparagine synthase-related protein [Jiulongibacter sediminis]|uniref:asparagine synthase-related protein n=1 Tax=Jiulongibacter sediminis TaxID=1605367 RepID=UPI0026EA40E7|nr:asparagine synthase-related protein [Jiulongibacter sediminis]